MKKLFALLLVTIMVFSFVACANDAPATPDAPAEQPADDESQEEAAPAAGEDVTLSVMLVGYGRYRDAVDDLVEVFKQVMLEERGINLTVNVEYPAEREVLNARLASGAAPDVFNMHVAIDAPLYDVAGYLPDLSDHPVADLIFDSVREMATIDGRLVGIPLETFVWSVLYNKDHFNDHGLTFPDTISELEHAIEVFHANGIAPFSTAFNDPGQFVGWASQVPMCAIAAIHVPDFYERIEAGNASFQEIADHGWLDILQLIFDNGTPRALDTSTDDGLVNFANGDSAILVTGPWYSSRIMEVNPDFNLGLGALPIDENPNHAVVMLATSTAVTYYPNGAHADIAREFVAFFLDDRVTDAFFSAAEFNQLASNQNVEMFPWTADGVRYVEAGRIYAEHGMPGSVYEALGRGAQMLFDGQITREEYIQMLDEAYAAGLMMLDN